MKRADCIIFGTSSTQKTNAQRKKTKLQHVPKNTEEMTHRACQHKKMPNRMMVRQTLPKIEYASERIKQSSQQEPHHSCSVQGFCQRNDCNNCHPSHCDVCRRGYVMAFAGIPHLDQHACNHRSPLNPKDRPPQNCMTART